MRGKSSASSDSRRPRPRSSAVRPSRLPWLAAAVGATVLMLALAGSASSFGPTASSTWVVSGGQNGGGVVASTAVSGSTAYLGGNFTYVGPPTGSFVAADSAGALASPWPAVGGNVYAVAPDGSNGFFIGGLFSSVGTKHANNLAHIKSDGTLDTAWSGSTNGTVNALAVSGGTVYAGGDFTTAGGAARTDLAAFSAASGALVTAFTGNATGTGAVVYALEASGSVLYVGGFFTTLGGSSRANLGAVDAGTGAATGWTANTDGAVYALAAGSGVVYAGGDFVHVNGSTARNFVAAFEHLDRHGHELESERRRRRQRARSCRARPSTRAERSARSAARPGTASPPSTPRTRAWPRAGIRTSTARSISLAVSGTTVYAGGTFAHVNGATARDNAAGFDTTTGTATSFATVVGGTVWSLAVSGTTVGMGGEFRTAGAGGATTGPVPRSNLAAIDLDDRQGDRLEPRRRTTPSRCSRSRARPSTPAAPSRVANGLTRHRLAAFTTAGAATPWNPGVHNGEVLALTVVGSAVYVGGTFSGATSVSNPAVERNYAAAFQAERAGQRPRRPDCRGIRTRTLGVRARRDRLDGVPRRQLHDPDPKPRRRCSSTTATGSRRVSSIAASASPRTGTPTSTTPSSRSRTSARRSTRAARSRRSTATWPAAAARRSAPRERRTATDWDPVALLGAGEPGTSTRSPRRARPCTWRDLRLGRRPVDGVAVACTVACFLSPSVAAVSLTLGVPNFSWAPAADDNVLSLALAPQGLVMGGVFTATGFPPPGSTLNADEPAAAYRGGFALVRALPDAPTNVTATPGDGTATVTWQAPAYTGGGPVTSYPIAVDPDGTRCSRTSRARPRCTGLTNGDAYTFSVYAITGAGIGESGDLEHRDAAAGARRADRRDGHARQRAGLRQLHGARLERRLGDHGLHRHRAAGEHHRAGHEQPDRGHAGSRTARPTPSRSPPRTRSAPRPASAPSGSVTPRTVPGAPTGVDGDARQRPGDRQLHRARRERRRRRSRATRSPSSPGGLTAHGHDAARSPSAASPTARATPSPSRPRTPPGDGPASAPSNAVTPRTVPGAPTGCVGDARERAGDGQLHGAGVERRLGDHAVHGHLVAGQPDRHEHRRQRHRRRAG